VKLSNKKEDSLKIDLEELKSQLFCAENHIS
jgi:hypothetical protein